MTIKKAPVIAVLNMKGGVGKTTITAHLPRHLCERLSKTVLLVDFDPQFNLSQTLLTKGKYAQLKSSDKTVMSVMESAAAASIFNVTTNLGPAPKVEDVADALLVYKKSMKPALSLIAGDFGLTKYSLIEDQTSLIPIRKRFLSFIEEAREKYDLVCIDCNPSSSFMTLCALMAATHILVPVRPDRYSILGLELLDQFIDGLTILATKPKMMVLINGVPTTGYDQSVENTLRSNPRFGPITLANTLKMSSLLAAKDGYTGFATDKKVAHREALKHRLSKIVDELKGQLGW